jgi:hypothetical protein
LHLTTGNLSTRQILAIPIAYVKFIELAKGKTYIEVFFGSDSNEHLRINNEKTRNEVFEYLQKNLTGFTHSVEKYSSMKAGKKPLIAMIVLTLLFAYTFYIANAMENGVEYEVVGNYNSIAGIVLVLASQGVQKVSLLFGSLLAIAIFSFYRKTKTPPVIDRLVKTTLPGTY